MSRSMPDDDATRRWPRGVRILVLLVVIAVVVVVLFTWVFPWVEELTQNPTIGSQLLRRPR
jgi:Tfp pilus assembly protein PilO